MRDQQPQTLPVSATKGFMETELLHAPDAHPQPQSHCAFVLLAFTTTTTSTSQTLPTALCAGRAPLQPPQSKAHSASLAAQQTPLDAYALPCTIIQKPPTNAYPAHHAHLVLTPSPRVPLALALTKLSVCALEVWLEMVTFALSCYSHIS